MNDYHVFLEKKKIAPIISGFDVNQDELNTKLFDFQRVIVKWALKRGRAAIFADTGLGKTLMQTSWAHEVVKHTNGNVIIFAPLCVAQQTVREGLADYLVVFRKHGVNPDPVSHTAEEFPVEKWQQYASPVWFDIDQSRTLNFRDAREDDDVKHICPLQLDVIERAMDLWTAPNDLVFSPFTGVGSEGYTAVKMGRRFIGSELKKSYYEQAIKNIGEIKKHTIDLF